jgi:hypothetical protein
MSGGRGWRSGQPDDDRWTSPASSATVNWADVAVLRPGPRRTDRPRLAERMVASLREIIVHCRGHAGRVPRRTSRWPARTRPAWTAGRGGRVDIADIYPLHAAAGRMLFHTSGRRSSDVTLTRPGWSWRASATRRAGRGVLAGGRRPHPGVADGTRVGRGGRAAAAGALAGDRAVTYAATPMWTGVRGRRNGPRGSTRYGPAHAAGDRRAPGPTGALIWTSHHIALDGWSLAQVFTEACQVYAGDPARPGGRSAPISLAGRRTPRAAERYCAERPGRAGTPPRCRTTGRRRRSHRASSSGVLPLALARRLDPARGVARARA